MKWSPQQDQALKGVAEWLRSGEHQVFRLFGWAGTGKSELAKEIGVNGDHDTIGMAFTGKAASVMRERGFPGASTIHSSIYHPKNKSQLRLKELELAMSERRIHLSQGGMEATNIDLDAKVTGYRRDIERERENLSRPSFTLNEESLVLDKDLVVVDECSFVDDRIGQDLLSFGTKVLVLGDPAQLPPVRGNGFFTHGVDPDFMLTDIHRQARDNPIIAMATEVREERALKLGTYGSSSVVNASDVVAEDALEADQVLVGRNKTRRGYNRRIRSLRGHDEVLPICGDKLVCLRNNHDKGLLNGSVWVVEDVGEIGTDRIFMTLHSPLENITVEVESHTHYFEGREEKLEWWERREADEFDYGNAMTVHKFQGSQDDKILLIDESWCFRKDRWKHVYTGITRASETIRVAVDR